MDWYRDIMRNGGMHAEFARDIILVDLRDLEELASLRHENLTWTQVLQDRQESIHRDMNVHSFLADTGRLPASGHPVLVAALEETKSEFESLWGPGDRVD